MMMEEDTEKKTEDKSLGSFYMFLMIYLEIWNSRLDH